MHRHVARALLVFGLLAGVGTALRAGDEESRSSWTGHLWPGSWFAKKVPEGKKDAKGEPVKDNKADVEAARRLRAELEWKRRAEVCQKLRQIAFETHDDELDRFAERLDQRAWDTYVRQTGVSAGGSGLSLDERVIGERIGVDFNLLTPGPKTLPAEEARAQEVRP